MIPEWLTPLLQCPKTSEALRLLTPEQLERWQKQAAECQLQDGLGNAITSLNGSYLCNQSESYLYPIEDGVPKLNTEHGIQQRQLHN